YEGMIKGGKRGKTVVPGNSAASPLIKLCSKTTRPFMPPRTDDPLTPNELALIKLWIDQGAKAPTGVRVAPKVIVKAPSSRVSPVFGVAVAPDKSAVVASRGNQVHVYDATSGNLVRSLIDDKLVDPDNKAVKAAHLSLVESVAISPDGKWIATGSYQEIALWDLKTGELKKKLTGFAERVVALAFSHNSKLLACGGGAPTQDGEIKVVDIATTKVTLEIKTSNHSDTVLGLSFSPDDKMLASCGADKFVKVF